MTRLTVRAWQRPHGAARPPSEAHHNLRIFDPAVLFTTVASASKVLGLSSKLYEPNEEDVFSTLQYACLEKASGNLFTPIILLH